MVMTLEEALKRIAELEAQNAQLLDELEHCKSLKKSGRKKHNESWTLSYNNFVVMYESGMTIMEIVEQGQISRRTAYRYKAYYDALVKESGK